MLAILICSMCIAQNWWTLHFLVYCNCAHCYFTFFPKFITRTVLQFARVKIRIERSDTSNDDSPNKTQLALRFLKFKCKIAASEYLFFSVNKMGNHNRKQIIHVDERKRKYLFLCNHIEISPNARIFPTEHLIRNSIK